MQQCLMVMHDDAHDQILVAFNIWDVTVIDDKGGKVIHKDSVIGGANK
jgi:hypothetical protein